MNVRVNLNYPIYDGAEIVFKAPCDASEVTGLIVYYPGDAGVVSSVFTFADAHANDLGHIDELFAAGAVVKVILDTDTGMAFVQNAATNAYLENKFKNMGGGTAEDKVVFIDCEIDGDIAFATNVTGVDHETIYGLITAGKYPVLRIACEGGDVLYAALQMLESLGDYIYFASNSHNIRVSYDGDTRVTPANSGGSVDLSNYYTKEEVDQLAQTVVDGLPSLGFASTLYVDEKVEYAVGDISSAFDHIIALQEELISL